MQRRKVLLPEPDGPSSETTSPCWTVMSMLLSTSLAPYTLRTPTASTIGTVVVVMSVLRFERAPSGASSPIG
jgi:hypothetical protein